MNPLKNKTGGEKRKEGGKGAEKEGGMKGEGPKLQRFPHNLSSRYLLKRIAIQGKAKAVSREIDFFVLTS